MFKIFPPRVTVCGIKHALYVMSITSLGIECTLYVVQRDGSKLSNDHT